jgi:hypothetical protein
MTIKNIALFGALTLAAACGGGGGDGPSHDTDGLTAMPLNAQGGASAAQATAGLSEAFAASDGDAAAGGVLGLNGAAMSLALGGSARRLPANVAGDCICDETHCVFDQCGSEGAYLSGEITLAAPRYTWDLTFTSAQEGQEFNLDYVGDLTVTETEIDGSAYATGGGSFENEGRTIELELDWELGFNQVQLDPACTSGPVGGSLDAFSRFKASSGGQSAGYYAEGTVTFGPGCGEVVAN